MVSFLQFSFFSDTIFLTKRFRINASIITVHHQVFCTFKISKIAQKSSDGKKITDLDKKSENSRISRQMVYRLEQHYFKNQRNKKMKSKIFGQFTC